jgi:hypothetical protein
MASAIQSSPATFGRFTVSNVAKGQTPVQNVANIMWLPMLLMGLMFITTAVVFGIFAANSSSDLGDGFSALSKANAETLNTLSGSFVFFGEAMFLAGISFLLATILGALRKGGGEVQEAVTSSVKTLRMPWPAWAFLGLMMMGVIAAIIALGFSIFVATEAHGAWINATGADSPGNIGAFNNVATYNAWVKPLREAALGLILAGVAFSLFTISNVLGFQFARIRELILGQEA